MRMYLMIGSAVNTWKSSLIISIFFEETEHKAISYGQEGGGRFSRKMEKLVYNYLDNERINTM